jgi:hypothetical protein
LRILPHARITSEEFTRNSLLESVQHCGRVNLFAEANPSVELEPPGATRPSTIRRSSRRPLSFRATRLLRLEGWLAPDSRRRRRWIRRLSSKNHAIAGAAGLARVGCGQTHREGIRTGEGIAALHRGVAVVISQMQDLTYCGARTYCGGIGYIIDHGRYQQCGQDPNCARKRFHLLLCT